MGAKTNEVETKQAKERLRIFLMHYSSSIVIKKKELLGDLTLLNELLINLYYAFISELLDRHVVSSLAKRSLRVGDPGISGA